MTDLVLSCPTSQIRRPSRDSSCRRFAGRPCFSARLTCLLWQVQLGEELLANGDITNGVEHLALAVAVCGQPHSLLSVLQQTLPPQIYQVGVTLQTNSVLFN